MLPFSLDKLAHSNLSALRGRVRGVFVTFHGMGEPPLRDGLDENERDFARHGILWLYPYCGPWSWMNRATVGFVEMLLDHVWEACDLSDDAPLIVNGCSMGGFAALVFARDSKRSVSACIANCPATDLVALCEDRIDVPRSVAFAHRGEPGDVHDWMREHSPLHKVETLARVPYLLVHGDADQAVLKHRHGDPMAAALRDAGHDVEYIEVPGMPHCGPLPDAVVTRMHRFVLDTVGTDVRESAGRS